MSGNVTKEGITADLEWMKRVGIAGMQMFDGSLGDIDPPALMDGDFGKTTALPIAEGARNAWIQFEFARPFPAQEFWRGMPDGEVQASEDGAKWVTLVSLPGPKREFGGLPVRTFSFPKTTAKFYRVLFFPAPPNPILAMFGTGPSRQFTGWPAVTFAKSNVMRSIRVKSHGMWNVLTPPGLYSAAVPCKLPSLSTTIPRDSRLRSGSRGHDST